MRVLRHDAAVPDQRADAVRATHRRRRARHVRPREPEADDEPAHARDADPARVGGPQRAPWPARRRDRQPDRLPRHRRRLRPQRGLPQPGAAELAARRHLRPRVRLRARRQHLLRDLDLDGPDHRRGPHEPEGPDDRGGHGLQLARPDDLRRRQPRLRRRQPGPVHPRHERDPGAQAGRAVQGDLQARLARAHDPAGRAADHDRRPALPGRDRRVLERRERRLAPPPTGPRSAPRGSSTSPTSATRRSSPTSASPCTSARTVRPSPTTPARRASCRATRATTATCRGATTRRSSPAA